MSDQIAHAPLKGPTTYDFGQATPKEWPQGPYVPKDIYDALEDELVSIERIVGSVATSLAMFPSAQEPAAQKVFLENALNMLTPALDVRGSTKTYHDVAHAAIICLARQIERLLAGLTGIAHCDICQGCRKNAEEMLAAYRSQSSGGYEAGFPVAAPPPEGWPQRGMCIHGFSDPDPKRICPDCFPVDGRAEQ